jgi:hypothetical protein
MTRALPSEKYDPRREVPSSVVLHSIPRIIQTYRLPEALFLDDHRDPTYLFGNMGSTVDALRQIIRCLPRGEGLGPATRKYFGLQWKQFTPSRTLMTRQGKDLVQHDAFYCYETLFFRMCEAARQLGRGKEIEEALPRPRLLLEAVILSDGCVEGLKEVAVKLDDHDYKTTHAELKALMKSIETTSAMQAPPQELAVERLDEWREWSLINDDEQAYTRRRGLVDLHISLPWPPSIFIPLEVQQDTNEGKDDVYRPSQAGQDNR